MTYEEPTITINGVTLNSGQAFALRVAASSFLMEMGEPSALGGDDTGRGMAAGYRDRIREVLALIKSPQDQGDGQ